MNATVTKSLLKEHGKLVERITKARDTIKPMEDRRNQIEKALAVFGFVVEGGEAKSTNPIMENIVVEAGGEGSVGTVPKFLNQPTN